LPQQILRHLYGIDDYAIGTHEAERAPNPDILGSCGQLSRRPARLQCLRNHQRWDSGRGLGQVRSHCH